VDLLVDIVRKYPKYLIRKYPFGNRISVYIRIYTAKYPKKYRIPQNTLIPLRGPYFRIYTVYIPQNTPKNTVCVSSYLDRMLAGGSSFVLPEVMGGVQRIIR